MNISKLLLVASVCAVGAMQAMHDSTSSGSTSPNGTTTQSKPVDRKIFYSDNVLGYITDSSKASEFYKRHAQEDIDAGRGAPYEQRPKDVKMAYLKSGLWALTGGFGIAVTYKVIKGAPHYLASYDMYHNAINAVPTCLIKNCLTNKMPDHFGYYVAGVALVCGVFKAIQDGYEAYKWNELGHQYFPKNISTWSILKKVSAYFNSFNPSTASKIN